MPKDLKALFRIQAPWGRGNRGSLFLVEEIATGRSGLLKILDPVADALELARVRRELVRQAGLDSRVLVLPLVTGDLPDSAWLFREHVEGSTVRSRLATARIEAPEALGIAAQIALGLEELHRAGLLHRDLKPGHVVLEPRATRVPRVRMLDAGIAGTVRTETGVLQGTAEYLSPEQITGGLVTFRSDLYALGALLFEMLTGTAPFSGSDRAAVLRGHLESAPPALRDGLPGDVPGLVASLLAKDPRERPFSAQHVLRVLEPYMLDEITQKGPAAKEVEASVMDVQGEKKNGLENLVLGADLEPARAGSKPPPPPTSDEAVARFSRKPPPPPKTDDVMLEEALVSWDENGPRATHPSDIVSSFEEFAQPQIAKKASAKKTPDQTQELGADDILEAAEALAPIHVPEEPPLELEDDEIPTGNLTEDAVEVLESMAAEATAAPAASTAQARAARRTTPGLPTLRTEDTTDNVPVQRRSPKPARVGVTGAFVAGMAVMGVVMWMMLPGDETAPTVVTQTEAASPPQPLPAPVAEVLTAPAPVAAPAPSVPEVAAAASPPAIAEPEAAPMDEPAPASMDARPGRRERTSARPAAAPSQPSREASAAATPAPGPTRTRTRAAAPAPARISARADTADGSESPFETLRSQARDHFAAGRYAEAATVYERATAIDPSHSGSFAGLGAARAAAGDLPGAVAAYQRAVELSPDHSGRFAALGRVLLQAGRQADAAAAYRRSLELDPNNAAARNALSHLGQ